MTLKAIYRGPPHYWNHYSLNPRERFYYGYYGMYGPQIDMKDYEVIEDSQDKQIENFGCECVFNKNSTNGGCNITQNLLWIIIIVALIMIYVK
jgi:hypothetical protein